MAAPAKSSPRDAQVMSAILKDMGVVDHEPRVINQMLEFTYRYVTDVLDDAKIYSSHAGKKSMDADDVRLAVQCKMDHSFTTPPPRDLLMEISRHKNSQPLPLIKPYSGPRLPPDRYCLSAPNYRLASHRKKPHRIQIGMPVAPMTGGHRISLTPVQKQTNKLQIGSQPPGSMTIINRPAPAKPIVRVSQGAGLLSMQGTSQLTVPGTIGQMPQVTGAGLLSMQGTSQLTVPGTIGQMPQVTGANLLSMQGIGQLPMQGLPGTSPITIAGRNLSLIPNLMNPLKRKLDDDDYDQT